MGFTAAQVNAFALRSNAHRHSVFATTFLYQNTEYTGIISGTDKSAPIAEGGILPEYDATLRVRSTTGIAPSVGGLIRHDSVNYRIERITTHPISDELTLALVQSRDS